MKKREKQKKETKQNKKIYLFISLIAIILLSLLVYFLFFINTDKTNSEKNDDDFFECLSKISTLYVQKGCSHCTTQKNILGEGIKYINTIDCMEEREKCSKISGTPTWIINGKMFVGVQSIEKLKSISNC